MGTKKLCQKNSVTKKFKYEKNWVRKQKMGIQKLGTNKFWYGKKLGVRGRSTPGELDPQSHILGPFLRTSDKYLDKYLDGNSMDTYLWRTIWVESKQDLVGKKRNVL